MFVFIEGQDTINKQFSPCECCPSTLCPEQAVRCSTNINCQCLLMTMTDDGICVDATADCRDLIPCKRDNKTCSIPNTICVNHTQCHMLVCYPLYFASSKRCPSSNAKPSSMTTGQHYRVISLRNRIIIYTFSYYRPATNSLDHKINNNYTSQCIF